MRTVHTNVVRDPPFSSSSSSSFLPFGPFFVTVPNLLLLHLDTDPLCLGSRRGAALVFVDQLGAVLRVNVGQQANVREASANELKKFFQISKHLL